MSHGSLALAPIGNCAVSALVDGAGRFVWACAPRVDGDPLFCNLLSGRDPGDDDAPGVWAIDLQDCVETSQSYDRNTATLRTVLTDARGGAVELVDFCPRYRRFNRTLSARCVRAHCTPLKGSPRIVCAWPRWRIGARERLSVPRLQSYSLSCHDGAAAPRDHGAPVSAYSERALLQVGRGARFLPRPGRTVRRRSARHGARHARQHAGLLAGMVAHVSDAARMASASHPRRDFAEALRLRRDRRDRRGDDDVRA